MVRHGLSYLLVNGRMCLVPTELWHTESLAANRENLTIRANSHVIVSKDNEISVPEFAEIRSRKQWAMMAAAVD